MNFCDMSLKKLQGYFIAILIMILSAPLITGCDNIVSKSPRDFSLREGYFYLNDTFIVVASTEMSYARHPKAYWDRRMKQLKELGVNTIKVRVPWLLHEPQPAVFDFGGEKDIKEFCQIARENNLLVWLHVGPFVDEHMDMGGMPWWLLKDENIALRTTDSHFMNKVGRFYRALGSLLANEQMCNGGALAMIQIEEPASTSVVAREYLAALRDSIVAAGFDSTIITIATKKDNLSTLSLDGVVAAIDIDAEMHATSYFSSIKKIDVDAPILCNDIDRMCEHVWGESIKPRPWNKRYMRLFELLSVSGSFNLGSLNGGTSFGPLAGASLSDGNFHPYATSYDNDAIIGEYGQRHLKFPEYAGTIISYTSGGEFSIKIPPSRLVAFDAMKVAEWAPLFENLPEPIDSDRPLTMEQCNVGYGAVLYETSLPALQGGETLCIDNIHDYARIYLDGSLLAEIVRSDSGNRVILPKVVGGACLRILVDAMGRAADAPGCKDYKGVVGDVKILFNNNKCVILNGWKHYPLPASYSTVAGAEYLPVSDMRTPGYFRHVFDLSEIGDTYLSLMTWGRGEVFLNGHSLGRFWSIGPQYALYMPACWLKEKGNELIIIDWLGPEETVVAGVDAAVIR